MLVLQSAEESLQITVDVETRVLSKCFPPKVTPMIYQLHACVFSLWVNIKGLFYKRTVKCDIPK